MSNYRDNAWAPVGLDLFGATSIDEALKMAELDWEVNRKPVQVCGGAKIPNTFANVRSDNGKVLGIVKDKYKIVQNSDAFEFVNNLIPEGVEFEKGGVFHMGTSAWVEAKFPTTYNILGDDVECHAVFINSHDGKGSVKVCILPTRLFCSNQLNFYSKKANRKWSAVHSSKVDGRLEEAQYTLGLSDKYMKALEQDAESMAMKKLSADAFANILDTIYEVKEDASNRIKENAKFTKQGILACLDAPDVANFKGTAWGAALAVTDFVDHHDPLRNTANYAEARFEKIASGHPDVDRVIEAIRVA